MKSLSATLTFRLERCLRNGLNICESCLLKLQTSPSALPKTLANSTCSTSTKP